MFFELELINKKICIWVRCFFYFLIKKKKSWLTTTSVTTSTKKFIQESNEIAAATITKYKCTCYYRLTPEWDQRPPVFLSKKKPCRPNTHIICFKKIYKYQQYFIRTTIFKLNILDIFHLTQIKISITMFLKK